MGKEVYVLAVNVKLFYCKPIMYINNKFIWLKICPAKSKWFGRQQQLIFEQ